MKGYGWVDVIGFIAFVLVSEINLAFDLTRAATLRFPGSGFVRVGVFRRLASHLKTA
jgi:hypothetical protein